MITDELDGPINNVACDNGKYNHEAMQGQPNGNCKFGSDETLCLYSEQYGAFKPWSTNGDSSKKKTDSSVEVACPAGQVLTGLALTRYNTEGTIPRTTNQYEEYFQYKFTEFLTKDDVDIDILNNSEWIYLEGYRYDGVDSQLAFELAINETKTNGGKIALSLSDPFCVERHRKKFLDIIENGIDLIFCNEKELMSLTEELNLNSALKKCTEYSCEVVCTVAEKGVMIKKEDSWINVPTDRVKIVDTTGAGDLFATGYLYGILNGHDAERSAFFANQCAGQVIQILGCRLDSQKLSDLF